MEPEDGRQIIILVTLLFMSAFFSASETSLMSLSKIRLRSMVDFGVKGAERVERAVSSSGKLLGSVLVGNNLVNIAMSSLATALAIKLAGDTGGVIFATTAIVTIAILIFGEVTPKTYAAKNPERLAVLVVRPITFFVYLFRPIVFFINLITNLIIKLTGVEKSKAGYAITENELITMVNVSHEEGIIEAGEREMIHNVFDFSDNTAKDVMTPRMDMTSITVNATYSEVFQLFKAERFSRVPVYEENIDHIIGVLHFKDFVFSAVDNENFNVKDILRHPYFSYESKPTSELFAEMRKNSILLAIILDEYGGTSGLVSIEDLVEEIVGDIADEDDEEDDEITALHQNEYLVDGSTKIDDFNELAGTNLESEEFDSIAGFVIGIMGRIPVPGEKAVFENISFVVEETDKNRLEKIRIQIENGE